MQNTRPPTIDCSLCCVFRNAAEADAFEDRMRGLSIDVCSNEPLKCGEVWVTVSRTGHMECWDMSEALQAVFSAISRHTGEIRRELERLHGTCLLDIECHRRDGYPAILFEHDVMEHIGALKAEISIDMYDA